MSIKRKSYVDEAIKAVFLGSREGAIEIAVNVTTQAKLFAPVAVIKGGRLKNSIMWLSSWGKKGGNKGGDVLREKPEENSIHIGTAVEYGLYQEFGTRKMEAQPFLRPAADMVVNGTTAKRAMLKAMLDSVREHMRVAGEL